MISNFESYATMIDSNGNDTFFIIDGGKIISAAECIAISKSLKLFSVVRLN